MVGGSWFCGLACRFGVFVGCWPLCGVWRLCSLTHKSVFMEGIRWRRPVAARHVSAVVVARWFWLCGLVRAGLGLGFGLISFR